MQHSLRCVRGSLDHNRKLLQHQNVNREIQAIFKKISLSNCNFHADAIHGTRLVQKYLNYQIYKTAFSD